MSGNYRLISLDTSTTHTGYCIFLNGRIECSGVIKSRKDDRLKSMIEGIYSLLKSVDDLGTIIIERMSVGRNISVGRSLTEIIGAVRGYAIMHDMEFIEYNVATWRRLIAQSLGETAPRLKKEAKAWSIEKVKSIGIEPYDDNEADAINIGIARFLEFDTLVNKKEGGIRYASFSK